MVSQPQKLVTCLLLFFEWEEENLVRPLSLTGLIFGYAPDVSRRSRADCTKARENNIKHKEAKATVHTLYCCVCTYRAVGRSGNPEGMTSIEFFVPILLL